MKHQFNIKPKTNRNFYVLLALTFLTTGNLTSIFAQEATLNSLEIKSSGTQLLNNFSERTFSYIDSLAAKTDVTISAVPSASKANVDIIQNGSTYSNNSLLSVNRDGDNIITVKVTLGSSVNNYTINLTTPKIILNSEFNSLNIYQVMVSSFQDGATCGYGTGWGPSKNNGDLRGIINALDYIKGLGVNALWMTPVFDSSNSSSGLQTASTGYFCTDYFNIDPKFGTLADFKELVQKAHDRGLYVILDGVLGHHGGGVKPSPTGKTPTGGSNPVAYPGSLEFYKEVVSYWVNNFDIDGWRLDQCYQVSTPIQNKNYLKDIREAVEAACASNKAKGKTWGTLGYIVGEDWSSETNIQSMTYGGEGLESSFDFPSRYNIVNTFAKAENDPGGSDVTILSKIYKTPAQMGYSNPHGVFPNIFLTNHDLWRFGNLINAKYGYGEENDAYWRRYKIAITAMMAYTGPTTLYYGDEIGNIATCWNGNGGCGNSTYSDNVARTDGYISNFTVTEQDLHDYVTKLLSIRASHPALWRGISSIKIQANNILANLKTDDITGEKVLFVLNNNTTFSTAVVNCEGTNLVDLISGETIPGNGSFSIPMENLSARFFILK